MVKTINIKNLELDYVKNIIPEIESGRDFGELGRLAIIGGSYLNMNPPLISAITASKIALDSIYLLIPEKHARIRGFPSLTVSPILLPDFKITRGVVRKIIKYIKRKRIIADVYHIGPGLTGHKGYIVALIDELLKNTDSFILVDSGALYKEVFDLELDINRVVFSPHQGEVNQLFGVEDPFELESELKGSGYKILAKFLTGIYFFDPALKSYFEYDVIQPTRFGVTYVFTGLFSGFLAFTRDIERAALISQYIFMKTLENIAVNKCLHWNIEEFIESIGLVIKFLCDSSLRI